METNSALTENLGLLNLRYRELPLNKKCRLQFLHSLTDKSNWAEHQIMYCFGYEYLLKTHYIMFTLCFNLLIQY